MNKLTHSLNAIFILYLISTSFVLASVSEATPKKSSTKKSTSPVKKTTTAAKKTTTPAKSTTTVKKATTTSTKKKSTTTSKPATSTKSTTKVKTSTSKSSKTTKPSTTSSKSSSSSSKSSSKTSKTSSTSKTSTKTDGKTKAKTTDKSKTKTSTSEKISKAGDKISSAADKAQSGLDKISSAKDKINSLSSSSSKPSEQAAEPATSLKIPQNAVTKSWGFRFLKGVISEVVGEKEGWEKCIPKGMTQEDPEATGEVGSELDKKFDSLNPTLQKILKGVKKTVNFACSIKDIYDWISDILDIKEMAGGFVQKSTSRSRIRSKLLGQTVMMADGTCDIKCNLSPAEQRERGLGDSFIDACKACFEAVKKGIKKISEAAKKLFQPIVNFIKELINKVKTFAENSKVKIALKALGCVNSVVSLGRSVKGLIDKIAEFGAGFAAGGVGVLVPILKFIIGLICKWESFKKAIDYLYAGKRETGSKGKRWELYGRFLGALSFAIIDA
jgi:hypothetical protein